MELLYRTSWFLAVLVTGIVAGFMLGHALILAPFLDWLLAAGTPVLGRAYPAFRESGGRFGLTAYYAVAGLQVVSTSVFLLLSLATRRHRGPALVAGVAGVLWVVVHYGSGFGALEASVFRSARDVPSEVLVRFIGWNRPIHFLHAGLLAVALAALLMVPLGSRAPAQWRRVEPAALRPPHAGTPPDAGTPRE